MRSVFIEARSTLAVVLPEALLQQLPSRVALAAVIQFMDSFESVKKQIENEGKVVISISGKHAKYKGQMLGCDLSELPVDFDAYLLIGDGLFHPRALVLRSKKPVYVYNPMTEEYTLMTQNDVETILRKHKVAMTKYYHAQKVGLLVSTKPGQSNLKGALAFKESCKDKQVYVFLSNTLSFPELDQFPFIDCFINTMCPRIALDDQIRSEKPLINLDDVVEKKFY